MALTISVKKRTVFGDSRVVTADVTFDAAYVAGGLALNPSDLGFNTDVDFLLAAPAGGLVFEYDHAANKLKAIYPSGGASTPAAIADPIAASGAVAVTSSAAQAPLVAGRGREVGAATNLTTITTRIVAIGDGLQ